MILRSFGYVFLLVALAAFAYDGVCGLANHSAMTFMSVYEHWEILSPSTLAQAKQVVEGVNSYLWSPVLMTILVLPAWFVTMGIGVLLYVIGYQPPRPALPEGI
ncbi:MAG: hypothetical protein P8Y67_11325 [Alphaproteobacteria bacterium]